MKPQHINKAIQELTRKFGAGQKKRIAGGVRQAARLWAAADGGGQDFIEFCLKNFCVGGELDALFARFEDKLEKINGHLTALTLDLRLEVDEDRGPMHAIDTMFASYSPHAHLAEDLFKTKLAFAVLLNFPLRSLADCLKHGAGWGRSEWARTRLAQAVKVRVPAAVSQAIVKAMSEANNYINNYNVHLDKVVDAAGKPLFREGLRLISHWGLRDELKSLYVERSSVSLARQRTIYKIMERIIRQEIPACVVNSGKHKWNPADNTVDGKKSAGEANIRYAHLLNIFKAQRLADRHYYDAPTLMDRRFNLNREIPEREVERMFADLLTSPVVKTAAALIRGRLGRKLEPFDIWYDGFSSRGAITEAELDKLVVKRFPDIAAFEKAIPDILIKLGFDWETARFLAARIEVDPARGAGHAWGPAMRGEKAHLRTRVPKSGMNYQGFNIAMHELGHCVEQVFSLYKVDHTLLQGVPNTAFTEGFAFVFQARDMEVLGLGKKDSQAGAFKTLDTFWSAVEISGVALVDMRVWNWMYKHPRATAKELKEAVIKTAIEVWNSYYAAAFGVKDSPVLAIYSHMIDAALYLPDYPLGFLIAFQIEDYFKSHSLAKEMERMCRLGSITPAEWMARAVGSPISPAPLVKAAAGAIAGLKAGAVI